MSATSRGLGPSIRTEGGLLPADLLARVASNDPQVPGLTLAAYHLEAGLRFGEAITRSWNRLVGSWAAFQAERAALPSGDAGTTATRERWLLPLFDELGYGRLQRSTAVDVEGKTYPVSHAWNDSPIHLIGCRVALDRRTERVAGAAGQAPHGLVQELLNRSPGRLWGFVSNGLTLRILRDNATLTRQAYVEFDLEAIFDGEAYADFALLWLVAHQSRVEGEKPETCWLEQWTAFAAEAGTRALDKLRVGVETAISALGTGFLGHPTNGDLRDALRDGALDKQDYYRELLRLVYRLLFLFTAEDRGLLLDPGADEPTRRRYLDYYSTARLRRLAERRKGSRHADQWAGLRVVLAALSSDTGARGLGLPALGGFLFSDDACPHLDRSELANRDLLDTVRALATIEDGRVRRSVDYRNLGAEELGGVYESLLELHPELDVNAGTFALTTAGGHERKTTGSYYTPTSLINVLLDSALDPVLAEAAAQPDAAASILRLAIVDPAAGSGHFLVAAAHRIAKRLATARTGDEEPSPGAVRTALRDVIGHCIYAVDVNPMAVELCKVSLWLEAIEPGKPLSFLDAHIKSGNSLLGTTPALVESGIPDAAYEPITGDDRVVARAQRARNASERGGQQSLLEAGFDLPTRSLAVAAQGIDDLRDDDPGTVRRKAERHRALVTSSDFIRSRLAADSWCAAFVSPKLPQESEITTATTRQLAVDPPSASPSIRTLVETQAAAYGFFHWALEFPQVFERGGFDVVLGNPPWERVKLQEKEFFAERNPSIARARSGADRKRMIAALEHGDPALWQMFRDALRHAEGESHVLRNSGCYPLAGRGDINTYAVFAELMRSLVGPRGQMGAILPTGIATDDTTKDFFGNLVARRSLASLYSFENEEFVFPAIHHATKFCLLTLSGAERTVDAADLFFFARQARDLASEGRHFSLAPDEFALLNPNTLTCPTFRSGRDAEIAKAVYRRVPVLIREGDPHGNPWDMSFMTMFHMTNDSGLFQDSPAQDRLPLYEAKMIHQFDHRFGTYEGQTQEQANQGKLPELTNAAHADARSSVEPKFWIDATNVASRLEGRWDREWFIGWRDIVSSVAVRTVIASALPIAGVGNKIPLAFSDSPFLPLILANLNSFVLDWQARQKVGGITLNFYLLRQFPVLPPASYRQSTNWVGDSLAEWVRKYVGELMCTAWDMAPFGRAVGWEGAPFIWDGHRRAVLRAELDGAFFHLYGLARDEVEHVLESFWVVRDRDEKEHSSYRTRELILDAYDAIGAATPERPFVSNLVPGPGDPAVAHAPRPGESRGRWVPWADVERATEQRSASTGERRLDPHGNRPAAAPPIAIPTRLAQPEVQYPEVAPAHRRAAESTAPAPTTSPTPSQGTLADLARQAATSADWLPEETMDPASVTPGRRVRHRRFGEGVVTEVRRTVKPLTVTIRFSDSDDREIAIGYGLLEFAAD
jgi:hypothetical protein